jgi:hypothetical protein
MTPFEYVIVLVSIILGLGVTTILTGVADWIKHRPKAMLYTPYIIWIILVFVLHMHEWWECYSYRTIEEWKLPMFLWLLLYPINLYVLAHLLFPAHHDEGYSGKDFYLKNWPKLFTSALLLPVISIAQNVVISNFPWQSQVVQFLLIVALSILIIRRSNNEVLHYIVSILLLLIMLISLLTVQESLVIGN